MTLIVNRSGIDGAIKPNTSEWVDWFKSAPEGTKIIFEWLDGSFKSQKFSAYRRKRYWEAQKRVSGKLRNTTLKPENVTVEALEQVGARLTAYNWTDKFETEESGKSQYQTSVPSSSQPLEEITRLRAENEQFKKREQYLLDQLGLVKTQIIHEAQERVKRLEARVNELDNANWQCEKNLTIVSELHRKSELKRQELQSLVDKYQTLPDQSPAIALQPTTNDQKLLTQAELAKRLGCDPGTLVKNRNKPNFQEWSRGKDPEGKAWKYLPDIQRYSLV
jgi:hypothetical protein